MAKRGREKEEEREGWFGVVCYTYTSKLRVDAMLFEFQCSVVGLRLLTASFSFISLLILFSLSLSLLDPTPTPIYFFINSSLVY